MSSLVERVNLKAPLALSPSVSLRRPLDPHPIETVTCLSSDRLGVVHPVETVMTPPMTMILVLRRVLHPPQVEEVEEVVMGMILTVLEDFRIVVEKPSKGQG